MKPDNRSGLGATARHPRLAFDSEFLDTSRSYLYTRPTVQSIFRGLKLVEPLVEVGSGRGFFLKSCLDALQPVAPKVARIDLDLSLINSDAQRFPSIQADGAQLPLASASVGTVLCHFVLSRVPSVAADSILGEVARVLKPGGRMLALEPCLSMATYRSPRQPSAGALMSIARAMKSRYQRDRYAIDEDIGLRLPTLTAQVLKVELTDLHVARWYTPFPEPARDQDSSVLRRRRIELESRDPVSDFLNAHGSGPPAVADEGPGIVSDSIKGLTLNRSGLERLHQMRIEDIQMPSGNGHGEEFGVDLIPVVRVLARKRVP